MSYVVVVPQMVVERLWNSHPAEIAEAFFSNLERLANDVGLAEKKLLPGGRVFRFTHEHRGQTHHFCVFFRFRDDEKHLDVYDYVIVDREPEDPGLI